MSKYKLQNNSFKGWIGIAQIDITPPVGIYNRNWGASKTDVASGIHRPLILTCISFQNLSDGEPLIILGADLGWWKTAEEEKTFRTNLLRGLAIKSSQLIFCLSHTHSSPSISYQDTDKPGGQFIASYLDQILNTSIKVVETALSLASKAVLSWNYGSCKLATNRDFAEGERLVVGYNPSLHADDVLLVGRITNENNKSLGTIVNYACHPTTLGWDNALISPDFIGSMREVVEVETGVPCLFLQGASGDLAPAVQYSNDVQIADKNGRVLGHSVLATLEEMLPPETKLIFDRIVESGAPLALWKYKMDEPSELFSAMEIPVSFSLKEMPSLKEIEKELEDCTDRVLRERLFRKKSVRKSIGDGNVYQVSLWVWRLGNSFIIAQPNEAYSVFQINLRRELLPFTITAINLANGSIGYLPPEELYKKECYSVLQTPFESGSLEMLTNIAIETVKQMLSNNENN